MWRRGSPYRFREIKIRDGSRLVSISDFLLFLAAVEQSPGIDSGEKHGITIMALGGAGRMAGLVLEVL